MNKVLAAPLASVSKKVFLAALLVLFTPTYRCNPFDVPRESCFRTNRDSVPDSCHKCPNPTRLGHHRFTLTHQSGGAE